MHDSKYADKNNRLSFGYLSLLLSSILLTWCVCSHATQPADYGAATTQLVTLVEDNESLKSMLIESIRKAKEINPDPDTNPVQNLQDYYEFVSWAETAMPWALLKKSGYPDIFDDMFQSIVYFYFLIDQPLPGLEGKGLVNNSLQYAEPFASWLTTFNKSWGKFLDTTDSWNERYYKMALDDPAFGLQQGWYEEPSNWKTFNQFFARYLRSPDQRPVASPDDDTVVASFADSEPQGIWAIDSNSNIVTQGSPGVAVKSSTLRSIENLIGEDSQYRKAFANGTFTHSFLNVNDYHRYHFPLGGTIREARIIQGINPTGGSLHWDAQNRRYAFDPSAALGWQSVETRGCVILETEKYGLVALLPIGMGFVGSVNFEANVKPGTQVKKGDMLGNFAFGGSDFVMLFQDKVDFKIDAPRREAGDGYQHLLMGERLGHVRRRQH